VENKNRTPHQPDDELVRRYVAGSAPPAEAEAFEEHYFGCDDCWREVEAATELGEAIRRPAAPTSPRIWPVLAAAAVAAFLFVGIWQMVQQQQPQSDREPAFRSSQPAFSTAATRAGSKTMISWESRPEACWYLVRRFSDDGSELDSTRVDAPQRQLELPFAERASHYRVEALDEFRSVIGDSGLQRLE
jgi:hypothetical protein